MVSVARDYAKAVREQAGWWGTYPLDLPLAVGDIVQLDDNGQMIKVGSALDRPGWREALPVETQAVSAGNTWSWHATKSRGGSAEAGASTAAGVSAHGSLKVSFSQVGGFVLSYTSGKYHRLRDVEAAKRRVLAAARDKDWEVRNVLVTEVLEASPATVLVSAEANSSIELSASASLPADVGGVNISDPTLGFSAANEEGSVQQTITQRAFPLYHCIRIHRDWARRLTAELQDVDNPTPVDVFADGPFEEAP